MRLYEGIGLGGGYTLCYEEPLRCLVVRFGERFVGSIHNDQKWDTDWWDGQVQTATRRVRGGDIYFCRDEKGNRTGKTVLCHDTMALALWIKEVDRSLR